jgi:hypothetical protein
MVCSVLKLREEKLTWVRVEVEKYTFSNIETSPPIGIMQDPVHLPLGKNKKKHGQEEHVHTWI